MALTNIRSGSTSKESSSKSVQRKVEKKLRFYAKVRDTVASLSAKKEISKKRRLRSRQKKLKAYDLSTLSAFLPEPGSAPRQQKEEKMLKLNSKSRQKIVEKESKQLRAVLNHPMFQSDPLAAIHQHLQSTQPSPEIKQGKRSSKTKKGKAKKNRSKLSGPDSMEI